MQLKTITFKKDLGNTRGSSTVILVGYELKELLTSFVVDYDNYNVEETIIEEHLENKLHIKLFENFDNFEEIKDTYRENFYDIVTEKELISYFERFVEITVFDKFSTFCDNKNFSHLSKEEKKALYFEVCLNDTNAEEALETIENLSSELSNYSFERKTEERITLA